MDDELKSNCTERECVLAVNEPEKAIKRAVYCGAAIADEQFSDNRSVMLNPAGYLAPVPNEINFESSGFALPWQTGLDKFRLIRADECGGIAVSMENGGSIVPRWLTGK